MRDEADKARQLSEATQAAMKACVDVAPDHLHGAVLVAAKAEIEFCLEMERKYAIPGHDILRCWPNYLVPYLP